MEVKAEGVQVEKYTAYKDSGVEWLGEIPAHWEVLKAKFLWKEKMDLSTTGDDTLLSVSQYLGVNNRELDSRSETLIGYKKVEPSDLVINIMLAWLGGLGVSGLKGVVSPAYGVYELMSNSDTKFLHYLYRTETYLDEFARRSKGVVPSRWRMYTDDFGQVLTLLPPVKEQTAIAEFLDRKTAQIEKAIGIKEKQIALLKERRQILIHKAVTRGLNPNATLKDSGVEWIGEIPEGWEVIHLRRVFTNLNPRRVPIEAELRGKRKGDFPYYGASGIIDYVDDYIFDEPLILIAEDGANLLSKSTPLAFVATGKYWVNNHAHIIKPKRPGFTYWAELLSSIDYTKSISGATQPKLTKDRLASVKIPVPPDDELVAISKYLDIISIKVSEATSIKKKEIEKLKEYKASLINSAVTGKIKVK